MFFLKILRHLMYVLLAYIFTLIYLKKFFFKKFKNKFFISSKNANSKKDHIINKKNQDQKVTVVLTCCSRPQELEITLNSFILYNTFPIFKFIIIEDGLCNYSEKIVCRILNGYNFEYIKNKKNLGQLKSIDIAYKKVTTKYIFHLEEDWIFTRKNFIEKSMEILEANNDCLFFSLRSAKEQNNHPLKICNKNNKFLQHIPFWKGCWAGFGFNPSLRRTSDYYKLIGGMNLSFNTREICIGLFYFIIGLRVYVMNYDEASFVTHIGEKSSTYKKFKKA